MDWLHNPCLLGVPNTLEQGTKSTHANKWADRLHNQPSGGHQRFRAGDKIISGPQMGGLATYPLMSAGSPTLQSRAQNQHRPTSGQIGYTTLTVWGLPKASKWGTKSALASKLADWLHNPCRPGGPGSAFCLATIDCPTTILRMGGLLRPPLLQTTMVAPWHRWYELLPAPKSSAMFTPWQTFLCPPPVAPRIIEHFRAGYKIDSGQKGGVAK